MSLAEWSGERTEYAVEYLAPEVYKGVINSVVGENEKWLAERRCAAENSNNGFECRVIQRTVNYGNWTAVVPNEVQP